MGTWQVPWDIGDHIVHDHVKPSNWAGLKPQAQTFPARAIARLMTRHSSNTSSEQGRSKGCRSGVSLYSYVQTRHRRAIS